MSRQPAGAPVADAPAAGALGPVSPPPHPVAVVSDAQLLQNEMVDASLPTGDWELARLITKLQELCNAEAEAACFVELRRAPNRAGR